MINNITGYTLKPQQNLNNTNSQRVSFGKAYSLARWNEAFNQKMEQNFIVDLISTLKNQNFRYLKTDGVTYRFESEHGDVFYTPAKTGLMSNLKFIPKAESKRTGFYIIDDGRSDESPLYAILSKSLNSVIFNKRSNNNIYKYQVKSNVAAKTQVRVKSAPTMDGNNADKKVGYQTMYFMDRGSRMRKSVQRTLPVAIPA